MSAVMEEKTFRGLREIAVLGLLAGALFLFISLFTFSIEDAGWTHSGTGQPIRNAGGVIGAWMADICLSFFGLTAYLFPVIIVWQSVLLYKRIAQTREQLVIIYLGIIAFITATAALMHLYMLRVGIELPRATGGILGEETGEKALNLIGNSGATIFLLVLLLASITLVTELSWVKLIDNVGKYVLSLSSQLWSWLTQLSLPKPTLPTLSTPTALEAVFEAFSASDDTPAPTKPSTVKTKPAATTAQASVASQHTIVKRPVVTYDASQGVLPSLELLDDRVSHVKGYSQAELEDMSRMVESILNDFNVSVSVVGYLPGPVITRFELQPAAGVKVSRISTLAKDLARALLVTSVRIVEIIPGKSVVGLEIPNREREMVNFRELMASPTFTKAKSLLTLGLGKDIAGLSVVADLAKMPHALVAGTTGSGKSVAINAMILSLLYKATPQQVRMIMIDPKMLELSVYEGIPHLLTPVVTDMKEASNALRWAVAEMERRYKLMSKVGVRNLAGFNQLIEEMAARGEAIKDPLFASLEPYVECPELTTLPSIVIIIDELADMMMIVGKKVEELIARLAQKARAAGIHLILATQRPSVDVLTGLIKANVPTRISFQVSSRIDSRTILDQGGAEALLGNGDMLFLPSGTSIPIRAHGAFVDDHEVHRVVEFLKLTAPPDYLDDITKGFDENGDSFSFSGGFSGESSGDEYYDQAVRFVTESRKASISSVQRRFKIGYNRAASIIEEMEKAGIVSPAETNGSRVVLAPPPPND